MNKFSVMPIIKEHLKTFKKVDDSYIFKDLIISLIKFIKPEFYETTVHETPHH